MAYLDTRVGEALVKALDAMVQEGSITAQAARAIVELYGEAMARELQQLKVSKAASALSGTLEADADTYACINDCWKVALKNAVLRTGDGVPLTTKALSLEAVPAKDAPSSALQASAGINGPRRKTSRESF
eukprot:TRINITY_DN10978_c0_g1_i1.p2 TRINITY_DN10978_c0_g1~~TRINITY_DN10978_c0_g1_i1.p2  ORF type:complete len:131 (+),score=21.62 TRINITY_DN10978_c0_g1_i1:173-565(+)